MGVSDCYASYGVRLANARWSWSGRSDDGRTVVVTLWQDRFADAGRTYRSWDSDKPGAWRSRPGFVELISNLAYARAHTQGLVRVVLAKARDVEASPRSIERCFAQPNLIMRVVDLDMEAGTYTLSRADVPAL